MCKRMLIQDGDSQDSHTTIVYIERQIDGVMAEWPEDALGDYQEWYGTSSHVGEHLARYLGREDEAKMLGDQINKLELWDSITVQVSFSEGFNTLH